MNYSLYPLSLVLLTTLTLSAAEFKHAIEGYPQLKKNCHEQAKDLGQRLAEVSGLKVTESSCVKTTPDFYNFEFTYESEKKVEFTSTNYKYVSAYPRSRYTKKADCEANLSKQTERFEAATELKHIFSYCLNSGWSDRTAWEIYIDGVGTARRIPQLGGYAFFSHPKDIPAKEYLEGLIGSLKRNDAVLASVVMHPSLGMAYAAIHYFAKDRLNFEFNEVSKVKKEDDCRAQADEVRSLLSQTSNPPFTIYCGFIGITANWELQLGWVGNAPITTRNSVETFHEFEECETERPELVKMYQTSVDKKVIGGVCSLNQNRKYEVVLFKKL